MPENSPAPREMSADTRSGFDDFPQSGSPKPAIAQRHQIVAVLGVELSYKNGTLGISSKDSLSEPHSSESISQLERERHTIASLLKSEMVLGAALNKLEANQLSSLIDARPNELSWIHQRLAVLVPDKTSTVELNFRCDEATLADGLKIVDQILDSYLHEVEQQKKIRSESARHDYKKSFQQLGRELNKRKELHASLTEEIGEEEAAIDPQMDLLALEIEGLERQYQEMQSKIQETKLRLQSDNEGVWIIQKATGRKVD